MIAKIGLLIGVVVIALWNFKVINFEITVVVCLIWILVGLATNDN